MKKKICFAASSGGHFEQIMCIREELKSRYDSFIVTEETSGTKTVNSISDTVSSISDVEIYYLELVNRTERDFPKLMLRNTLRSWRILKQQRPAVIISTGVLAVIPFCLIGKYIFGAKLIYIESFAKTKTGTMTGKLMYRFADRFMVQWPEMLKIYPKAVYKGGLY